MLDEIKFWLLPNPQSSLWSCDAYLGADCEEWINVTHYMKIGLLNHLESLFLGISCGPNLIDGPVVRLAFFKRCD